MNAVNIKTIKEIGLYDKMFLDLHWSNYSICNIEHWVETIKHILQYPAQNKSVMQQLHTDMWRWLAEQSRMGKKAMPEDYPIWAYFKKRDLLFSWRRALYCRQAEEFSWAAGCDVRWCFRCPARLYSKKFFALPYGYEGRCEQEDSYIEYYRKYAGTLRGAFMAKRIARTPYFYKNVRWVNIHLPQEREEEK